MIGIRPLRADEGKLLKSLRLGALEDSPDSFSPTYEEVSQHDDDYWFESATRTASSEDFEIFIAEYDGRPVGLVSGHADADKVGHIGEMWAEPSVRGKGVGKRLLLTVVAFLELRQCQYITLTVTETNTAAIALYHGVGFEMTGEQGPLRKGSLLKNLTMARSG